jgi:hypothetical protein
LRRTRPLVALVLTAALGLQGCRAVGHTSNGYFDWGGRTFTTNPASLVPYCLGFTVFFIAGLPLDLFSWIGAALAWPEGRGEDYQAAALAPSIFLGVSGGTLLGAPFFPLGLPWWNPDRDDAETPSSTPPPASQPAPTTNAPKTSEPLPAYDPNEGPAGAPGH